MTTETSRLSFAEVKPEIPEWKDRIIDLIISRPKIPDWSVREIASTINVDSRSIAPRVHELAREGKLFIAQTRMCGITLKVVNAYRLAPEIILSAREAMS